MDRLHRGLTAIEARLETEAVQVAVAVASKLAPELIAREPFAEISALAAEAFRQLVTTPQIAVHIGADIYEPAKEKLEEIARTRGFEGRLTILSDDTMAPGDCRIEWADGGINRDRAATARRDRGNGHPLRGRARRPAELEHRRFSETDAMSDDETKVPLPDLEGGEMQTIETTRALAPTDDNSIRCIAAPPTSKRCSTCR